MQTFTFTYRLTDTASGATIGIYSTEAEAKKARAALPGACTLWIRQRLAR